ncbi:hypothetical protein [Paracoccus benzoatiresistens]|uniref:Uncharacterized protein n=1 Tax=Paracoccus benzoatiresistens TaxID=2997341 RepID=A0ABT4J7J0_9RHOB|nr:hypothetical protein [Paracoccus sp. EF6]MCZ0963097.1 hypothetical protein [Paracoccus sp. EF6]
MPPETFTGRIRFLLLQPVDALRYAHGTPAATLGGLKAAAMTLLLVNFAFGLTLYHHGAMLDAVLGISSGLHTILVYAQRVFDLFARACSSIWSSCAEEPDIFIYFARRTGTCAVKAGCYNHER